MDIHVESLHPEAFGFSRDSHHHHHHHLPLPDFGSDDSPQFADPLSPKGSLKEMDESPLHSKSLFHNHHTELLDDFIGTSNSPSPVNSPSIRDVDEPNSRTDLSSSSHSIEDGALLPTHLPIALPPGGTTVIDGVTYNNRGYEVCGALNKFNKPCQRIGRCPFHPDHKKTDFPAPPPLPPPTEGIVLSPPIPITENRRYLPIKKGPYKSGWKKDEHLRFLKGLQIHGRGSWKDISLIVGTRTPTQIQVHAHRYYLRQQQGTKNKRSIHDISLGDLEELEVQHGSIIPEPGSPVFQLSPPSPDGLDHHPHNQQQHQHQLSTDFSHLYHHQLSQQHNNNNNNSHNNNNSNNSNEHNNAYSNNNSHTNNHAHHTPNNGLSNSMSDGMPNGRNNNHNINSNHNHNDLNNNHIHNNHIHNHNINSKIIIVQNNTNNNIINSNSSNNNNNMIISNSINNGSNISHISNGNHMNNGNPISSSNHTSNSNHINSNHKKSIHNNNTNNAPSLSSFSSQHHHHQHQQPSHIAPYVASFPPLFSSSSTNSASISSSLPGLLPLPIPMPGGSAPFSISYHSSSSWFNPPSFSTMNNISMADDNLSDLHLPPPTDHKLLSPLSPSFSHDDYEDDDELTDTDFSVTSQHPGTTP